MGGLAPISSCCLSVKRWGQRDMPSQHSCLLLDYDPKCQGPQIFLPKQPQVDLQDLTHLWVPFSRYSPRALVVEGTELHRTSEMDQKHSTRPFTAQEEKGKCGPCTLTLWLVMPRNLKLKPGLPGHHKFIQVETLNTICLTMWQLGLYLNTQSQGMWDSYPGPTNNRGTTGLTAENHGSARLIRITL